MYFVHIVPFVWNVFSFSLLMAGFFYSSFYLNLISDLFLSPFFLGGIPSYFDHSIIFISSIAFHIL